MDFGVWTKGLAALKVDCLVVGVFDEAELSAEAASVDAACGGRLKKLLERGDFPGRGGEALLLAGAAHRARREEAVPSQGLAQGLGRRGGGAAAHAHRQLRARDRPSRGART